MSDNNGRCDVCPQTDKVHESALAECFMLAVVYLPGQTPKIVTTPRYCVEPERMEALIQQTVVDGAKDIAKELRVQLNLPEPPDVAQTRWGEVALGDSHAGPVRNDEANGGGR